MPVVPVDAVAPFDGTYLAHFLLPAKTLFRFSHPSHARALESSIRRTVSTRDRALRDVSSRQRMPTVIRIRGTTREKRSYDRSDSSRVALIGVNSWDEGSSVALRRNAQPRLVDSRSVHEVQSYEGPYVRNIKVQIRTLRHRANRQSINQPT